MACTVSVRPEILVQNFRLDDAASDQVAAGGVDVVHGEETARQASGAGVKRQMVVTRLFRREVASRSISVRNCCAMVESLPVQAAPIMTLGKFGNFSARIPFGVLKPGVATLNPIP